MNNLTQVDLSPAEIKRLANGDTGTALRLAANDPTCCRYWADGVHCYDPMLTERMSALEHGTLREEPGVKRCACGDIVERRP